MAILDKQGLQHYANKMCNADNRKVGSKSLPTALNDIDTAIDGFKTLFETEYGTPVNMELENNENIFSVGTGTNVDKRSEVENGFTDVELSGNSLVNCVLIDKLYEDSNYLEFENSPVITEGNITLKSRQFNHVRFCPKIECGVIKPNTKYTLIFNVTSNNLTGRTNLTHTNTDTLISAFPFTNTIQPKQTGIFKYVLTSKEDIGSCNTLLRTIVWNDCNTKGETITFSLMILEGDWTNKPIPQYFEGLKSIGEKADGNHKISILSRSKNLFNINAFEFNKKLNDDGIVVDGTSTQAVSKLQRIKSNTKYIYKINHIGTEANPYNGTRIFYYDSNGNFIDKKWMATGTTSKGTVIATPSNAYWFRYYISVNGGSADTTLESLQTSQLEEGDSVADFSYYKEDKKEISLNEPLRGLPNGVKDTIEKVNGEWKIVRRCGEVVMDDSLSYNNHSNDNANFDEYKIFGFPVNNIKQSSSISDKFPQTANDRIVCTSGIVYIRFSKTKEINTLEKCQQWFKNNPTKVIYELETPIIEDISPITLQCWKNGTISIDEILPVETTHTVALNKSAQIQKNIEELTTLRNRVKALEEQYDKTALNQAYEVDLLRLDMQLDNII